MRDASVSLRARPEQRDLDHKAAALLDRATGWAPLGCKTPCGGRWLSENAGVRALRVPTAAMPRTVG